MTWIVEAADEFAPEFVALPDEVQSEIAALVAVLGHWGRV